MKRTIVKLLSLLLCAAVCLGITGCAPADEKAFERACELMDAGEYEAAIEAFSAIGMYQEISDKIDEAQELLDEENSEFLYGTWYNVSDGAAFKFSKGGKGTITADGYEQSFAYTCDGRNVVITEPIVIRMKVDKEDGITHIKDQDGMYDLVPEDEYEVILPETVEITLDNWQEYFELRQAQDVSVNAFGDIEWREIGYGIFLKEEYQERVKDSYFDVQVSFEVCYDANTYLVEGDLMSGDFILTRKDHRWIENRVGETMVRDVYDQGVYENRHADSDLNGTICAFFSDTSWTTIDDTTYLQIMDNVEVIRVTGTLILQG